MCMLLNVGKNIPILLNLERLVDGITFNNFIVMIIRFLIIFGGLLEIDIANEVVCFGVDDVTKVENMCYYLIHSQT